VILVLSYQAMNIIVQSDSKKKSGDVPIKSGKSTASVTVKHCTIGFEPKRR
jgi:hypothetical protein